ncbi:retrotransposon protein, putative, ty1-copia subclass [Tanacetum coccineum]|uniref:Retrotransposon protein, putative, ty1-copia subclass n=1 Tax=Tanacetum coccineum TaxID=301880 RepID=A0ABQ4Y2C9_9ASTR
MSQPANDDYSQHLSDDEASYHEDASDNGTATNKPKQQQQLTPTTTTISNIKLLILKKEEYDIWAWRIKDGVVRILSPVSAAKIHVVEKKRKARTILLMTIPKEHLRRFHGMDDAKEIWEAIRTRFGGNANSKKMQKVVLKQQFEAFNVYQIQKVEKGMDSPNKPPHSQLEAHSAEVSTEDAHFAIACHPDWSGQIDVRKVETLFCIKMLRRLERKSISLKQLEPDYWMMCCQLGRTLVEEEDVTNHSTQWQSDRQNTKHPIPEAPVAPPGQQVPAAAHAAWVKGKKEVVMLMLLTMDLEIQRNLAHLGAYDMLHFVQNYNMHGMGKTVNELHAMLKLHEETLPKKDANPALHAIRAGRVQKNQKNKPRKAAKGGGVKTPPPPKKDNPTKDAICYHCGEIGHWRRNCPVYLTELMKKKKLSQGASTSGIFTIELYSFPSKSWIYDTCCGTYICITTQGLRGSKKLKPGALSLYVGDGHHAAVEAIGTYHLELPSGLVIVLNNCHYAPSITRCVISVSRLYDDGFINRFDENNVLSVSKNNLVYFVAVPRDGIFEIDMSCSNTNDSSMYNVSNKRAKINLDSSYLWHCRLGHISKKRIEKLQHEGLLNSTDIQQGASYFITFTDDFSRYGYVYLLKHKHEVFETFKVFQKEVENQLGKTIKSLHSDRGGECMSQKFLDHLKEHGIIAHHTPSYTPQNNGMLERRNRTLLDMVRSMMSQTTLPKSFWDYALETAARILNMVPTKKALVKRDTLTKPDKLDPRSFRCIFVGYPKETMGCSFYSPSENKVFVARNAEFFENDLIDLKASGSVEDLKLIQEEDTNPSVYTSLNHEEGDQESDETQSDINPIRRSTRIRHPTDRLCLYIDAEEHELGDLGEPANYRAALLDPESKKWLDAMNVEMQSIKDNDVWVLVELPSNAKTVGSKWLFKKKTDMDGTVYVFKARLVAKGFTQTYGVDYEETFSPVADIRAIRILIAIAAYYDYDI